MCRDVLMHYAYDVKYKKVVCYLVIFGLNCNPNKFSRIIY